MRLWQILTKPKACFKKNLSTQRATQYNCYNLSSAAIVNKFFKDKRRVNQFTQRGQILTQQLTKLLTGHFISWAKKYYDYSKLS